MKVNLCMTSWLGRINDIKPVIDSLLNQTYKDFTLWLTLSSDEFKNVKLPDFIVNCNDKRLKLNWVTLNYKTFKKVFPVLPYISDDDIIITADDDVIYDEHFIEYRIEDFKSNSKKYPITSNVDSYQYSIKSFFSSCGSLFTKKMLKGYKTFVNQSILNTYDDDWTYTFVIILNGYRFKLCSKYSLKQFKFINQDTSSKENVYDWREAVPVFQYRIADFVGLENFKDYIDKIRNKAVIADWEQFKKADKSPYYVFI